MNVLDRPLLLSVLALIGLSLTAWLGGVRGRRRSRLAPDEREDFGLVVGATLTLLGLIIGFSFSMAVGRYEQRNAYEEAEANAIGTAFVRADLLPPAAGDRVRALLRDYARARIAFYVSDDPAHLANNAATTARLQDELWSAVSAAATANPTAVTALVAAGINDVLNAQGYTQAAWWNRIPAAAWMLMFAIAGCSTFLVGYTSRNNERERGLLLVLPLVLSIAFYLIADIESPRGGSIRVVPQNLEHWTTAAEPGSAQPK